jgi:hypothetical protein
MQSMKYSTPSGSRGLVPRYRFPLGAVGIVIMSSEPRELNWPCAARDSVLLAWFCAYASALIDGV